MQTRRASNLCQSRLVSLRECWYIDILRTLLRSIRLPLLTSLLAQFPHISLPIYLKNLPTIFPANRPAMFPGKLPNAPPAKELAWLNLSQREKATVFVTVRIRAITVEQEC